MSIFPIDLALLFMAAAVLYLAGCGITPPEEAPTQQSRTKAKSAHARPSVRTRV